MKTAKELGIVRVRGTKRRIWRGWERRDRVKIKDKELRGYVLVVHQDGIEKESTIYGTRAVEGYNWKWLARCNSHNFKEYVPVEEFVGYEQVVLNTRIY